MRILLTGGAGFIGSNLVEAFLNQPEVELVRVLDNFATGSRINLRPFENNARFELVEGDIRDVDLCLRLAKDVSVISHQAALGSVPRSINDPITTNDVNINGTLNIFNAAKEANVKRVVFAASSSTYGDSLSLPKVEDKIGKPLSPYAVTKYVNEVYADVFARTYDTFNYIGLRYFNVFGPNQSPSGAYAAVIPLFIHKIMNGESPVINGDGEQSRDFTYIANVVQANLKAIYTDSKEANNQVYNVAFGDRTTLNQLYGYLKEISGTTIDAVHGPDRRGDIRDSLADVSKAKRLLGYDPQIPFKKGLELTFEWFKNNPSLFTK